MDPTALFLGPQGQNADDQERLMLEALRDHVHWRRGLHPEDPDAVDPLRQLAPDFRRTRAQVEAALRRLLARLKASVPFHSPRYLGHMTSDTLLPAQVGYLAAMLYNPNNVAHEGSPVTSELEREVADDLARLMGLDPALAAGHLCSGGTLANVEALWVLRNLASVPLAADAVAVERLPAVVDAGGREVDWRRERPSSLVGRLAPDALVALAGVLPRVPDRFPSWVVLVPTTCHYSWDKAANLLGIPHENLLRVPVDRDLRLDVDALEQMLETLAREGRPVLACVGVLGNTEAGSVDPVHRILELRRRYAQRHGRHFFVHLDAAYGGYARTLFLAPGGEMRPAQALADEGMPVRAGLWEAMAATGEADSITIDPHKLGFVPYPAGALLLRDRRWRTVVAFAAAYVSDGHTEEHSGSFVLEGSRPGAAAAACWLAHRTVPLDSTGYGAIMHESFLTARGLAELLDGRQLAGHRCVVLQVPDLDVLLYAFAPELGATLASVNAVQALILSKLGPMGPGPFSLTSTRLSPEAHGDAAVGMLERLGVDRREWVDGASLVLLRSVMMTPFLADAEVKSFYRAHLVEALQDVLSGAA